MSKIITLLALALSAHAAAQTTIYAAETFTGTANKKNLTLQFPMSNDAPPAAAKLLWQNAVAPNTYTIENITLDGQPAIELSSTLKTPNSNLPADRLELKFAPNNTLQGIWTDDDEITSPAKLSQSTNPHLNKFLDFLSQHLREHNGKPNALELAPNFAFKTSSHNLTYLDGLIIAQNVGISQFSPFQFSYAFADESDELIKYGSTHIHYLPNNTPTVLLFYTYNHQEIEYTDQFASSGFFQIWQLKNNTWTNQTYNLIPAKISAEFDSNNNSPQYSYYFAPATLTLSITKTETANDDDFWDTPIQSDNSNPNQTFLQWQNSKFIKITNPTPKN